MKVCLRKINYYDFEYFLIYIERFNETEYSVTPMQPILRWAGSKRQLLSKLRRYCPQNFNRYVEPFCGSACLFFDLQPSKAILGDINGELIKAYRLIKQNVSLVIECIRRLPKGKHAYYRIRSVDPKILSDAEAAARFLYLNHYCFNGIYRTNKTGAFNVPFGPPRSGAGIKLNAIKEASALLQRTTLLNQDFECTLDRIEPGDFVYLDPPYAVAQRRIFAEYDSKTFSIEDLSRLENYLEGIAQKRANFLITYADSREARKLFASWNPKRVRVQRHIAGFAGARRHAYELLATNIKEIPNVI